MMEDKNLNDINAFIDLVLGMKRMPRLGEKFHLQLTIYSIIFQNTTKIQHFFQLTYLSCLAFHGERRDWFVMQIR